LKVSIEKIEQHYVKLCQEIGERHLGSEGEKQAAAYIREQFEDMGYEVFDEYYEAPGWKYNSHSFEIIDLDCEINAFPCFYSHSCNIEDTPVLIDRWEEANLSKFDIKGKICVVSLPSDIGPNVRGRNELAEDLDKHGAAVAVFISNHNDIFNSKIVRTPHLKQMGVICVSGDDAFKIVKNADKKIRIHIDAENFTCQSSNVVARLKQGEKKLVIGAHYDTPPNCPGAGDNASGTVALLEVAALLKDKIHNYSVDFVAFSGEEYGGMNGYPIGSYMYVEQHKDELKDIAYMFNFDDIGSVLGNIILYTNNKGSFKDYLTEKLEKEKILVSNDYNKTSDDYIFHENGIEVAFFTGTCNQYVQIHTPNDNLDRMSYEKTANFANIAADVITDWK
jgi:aminopeptidase YwaD